MEIASTDAQKEKDDSEKEDEFPIEEIYQTSSNDMEFLQERSLSGSKREEDRMIPVFKPSFGEEELEALREPFKTGWIGLGPKTKRV